MPWKGDFEIFFDYYFRKKEKCSVIYWLLMNTFSVAQRTSIARLILNTVRLTHNTQEMLPQHQLNVTKLITECFKLQL